MDYRELLKKYMAHILEREGCDYLGQMGMNRDSVVFSDDEMEQLERLSEEARS